MGSPSSDWKRLKYVKVGQVAQDKSRTDWKMTYAVNCPQVFFLYGLDLKSRWVETASVSVGWVSPDFEDWKSQDLHVGSKTAWTYSVNCPQVFFLYGLDLKSSWVETASVNVGWVLQNCLQTFSVNVGWMSYNYEG